MKNKKLIIVLGIVVVILLIGIGIGIGIWSVGDNTKVINNNNDVEETLSNNEENIANSKIDENKPWVYDANYGEKKHEKTMVNNTGKKYSSNHELIVPYININSEYAKSINEELEVMYETAYNEFGKSQNNAILYTNLKYDVYENDDILSIVVSKSNGILNGGGNTKKYTYNLNLKTLQKATLEEMCKVCGFDSESQFQDKKNIAIKNYESEGPELQVVENRYYIDENKKINIVIKVIAAGTYEEGLVIDKNVQVKEDKQNGQQQNNKDSNGGVATQEEIAKIQEFLNKGENNGFAQTNFTEDNANGLKLITILNSMPDGGYSLSNSNWTQEELKEVGVSGEQLHKYDVSKLNNFLKNKLGLSLDEIKNLNTQSMVYSKKYNAYYANFGDSNYFEVKVLGCTKDYNGKTYYVKGECAERTFEMKLLKTDDGYQFKYNTVK